jgi:hypothetical protein
MLSASGPPGEICMGVGVVRWGPSLPVRETFWVGYGCFFLGGVGVGKRKLQVTFSMVVFSLDDTSFLTSLFMLYYILISGGFAEGYVRPS